MILKDLDVGDVILAKKVNSARFFLPENYDAVVVEKGRKYIYFEVQHRRIKRELTDSLPSGLNDHHTSDCFLFSDEGQLAEYLLAFKARNKLSRFFSSSGSVNRLSDEQIEQINKIIGI